MFLESECQKNFNQHSAVIASVQMCMRENILRFQGNQKSRQQTQDDFLDKIAAKYAAPAKKGGKGKKRVADEDDISEEAFQAAAAKLKKGRK